MTEDLIATLGAKFEYSSYSGTELLPSIRLAWYLTGDHMIWGAVSRAVRTPGRIDRDLEAPAVLPEAGERYSEDKLLACEIGYREQPTERSTFSTTFCYHDYEDIRVDDLPSPAIPGYTAVDARLGWQVTDNLELSLSEPICSPRSPRRPGPTPNAARFLALRRAGHGS